MRSNWKQLEKDLRGSTYTRVTVTLNQKGYLVMPRRVWERAGAPSAFNVFFDSNNSRIGLQPTQPALRNAYKCLEVGRFGARRLHLRKLLVDFRIDLPETIEFFNPETDEEGFLILDLRTAKISNRAVGRKKIFAKRKMERGDGVRISD